MEIWLLHGQSICSSIWDSSRLFWMNLRSPPSPLSISFFSSSCKCCVIRLLNTNPSRVFFTNNTSNNNFWNFPHRVSVIALREKTYKMLVSITGIPWWYCSAVLTNIENQSYWEWWKCQSEVSKSQGYTSLDLERILRKSNLVTNVDSKWLKI